MSTSEARVDCRPVFYPSFFYRDDSAAIEWLCDAFGLEKLLIVPGPNGTIAHAELSYGTGVFMLGSADAAESRRYGNQAIYVAVEDPDAHYARAKAAGAEITREPEDTDYGSRTFNARDLEGNDWYFGTYRPAPEPAVTGDRGGAA